MPWLPSNHLRSAAIASLLLLPSATILGQDLKKPPFEWDDAFSSAGTSLALEETLRVPKPTGDIVWYQLRAAGFPTDPPLELWVSRGLRYYRFPAFIASDSTVRMALGHDTVPAFVVLVGVRDQGLAVVHGSSGKNGIILAGFGNGFPLRVALRAPASDLRAHAKALPVPLKTEAPGGCSASGELATESGQLWELQARGFHPGELVSVTSEYKKERLHKELPASDSGEVRLPILFGDKDQGAARFTAETEGCTVALEYKVGKDALPH